MQVQVPTKKRRWRGLQKQLALERAVAVYPGLPGARLWLSSKGPKSWQANSMRSKTTPSTRQLNLSKQHSGGPRCRDQMVTAFNWALQEDFTMLLQIKSLELECRLKTVKNLDHQNRIRTLLSRIEQITQFRNTAKPLINEHLDCIGAHVFAASQTPMQRTFEIWLYAALPPPSNMPAFDHPEAEQSGNFQVEKAVASLRQNFAEREEIVEHGVRRT